MYPWSLLCNSKSLLLDLVMCTFSSKEDVRVPHLICGLQISRFSFVATRVHVPNTRRKTCLPQLTKMWLSVLYNYPTTINLSNCTKFLRHWFTSTVQCFSGKVVVEWSKHIALIARSYRMKCRITRVVIEFKFWMNVNYSPSNIHHSCQCGQVYSLCYPPCLSLVGNTTRNWLQL
jgi:hypothetical protein